MQILPIRNVEQLIGLFSKYVFLRQRRTKIKLIMLTSICSVIFNKVIYIFVSPGKIDCRNFCPTCRSKTILSSDIFGMKYIVTKTTHVNVCSPWCLTMNCMLFVSLFPILFANHIVWPWTCTRNVSLHMKMLKRQPG